MAFVAAVDGRDFVTLLTKWTKWTKSHIIILLCIFLRLVKHVTSASLLKRSSIILRRFHFVRDYLQREVTGSACWKKYVNMRARRMKITHLHFLLALDGNKSIRA